MRPAVEWEWRLVGGEYLFSGFRYAIVDANGRTRVPSDWGESSGGSVRSRRRDRFSVSAPEVRDPHRRRVRSGRLPGAGRQTLPCPRTPFPRSRPGGRPPDVRHLQRPCWTVPQPCRVRTVAPKRSGGWQRRDDRVVARDGLDVTGLPLRYHAPDW